MPRLPNRWQLVQESGVFTFLLFFGLAADLVGCFKKRLVGYVLFGEIKLFINRCGEIGGTEGKYKKDIQCDQCAKQRKEVIARGFGIVFFGKAKGYDHADNGKRNEKKNEDFSKRKRENARDFGHEKAHCACRHTVDKIGNRGACDAQNMQCDCDGQKKKHHNGVDGAIVMPFLEKSFDHSNSPYLWCEKRERLFWRSLLFGYCTLTVQPSVSSTVPH